MYKKYCEICGRKFETRHPQTRVCSDECRKKKREEWKSAYNENQSSRKRAASSNLAEVSRLAREAGMSYGKYVAKMYKEKLKNERTM